MVLKRRKWKNLLFLRKKLLCLSKSKQHFSEVQTLTMFTRTKYSGSCTDLKKKKIKFPISRCKYKFPLYSSLHTAVQTPIKKGVSPSYFIPLSIAILFQNSCRILAFLHFNDVKVKKMQPGCSY